MKFGKLMRCAAMMLALLVAAIGFAGCTAGVQAQDGSTPSTQAESTQAQSTASSAPTAQIAQISAKTDIADTDATWDESSSTMIALGGESISVEGSGATASGSVLTITKAGTYVISGSLTNGQIVVSTTKDDTVRIVLNGAQIANKTGAPVYASQCDKLIITLAEGTHNTLTDGGADFVYDNTADEEPNAALFCKDDLTINGTGSLTVNAVFNNGIGTKDDLLIVSGTIAINAANHGLRGNDSVTVLAGDISITAGNDGVQTNNIEDATKGWVLIEGGSVDIVSVHDGIQADTTLSVTGGTLNITAGGGEKKAQTVASSDTTSDSYKGLKSAGDIAISAGVITVDSYDDSVHANGSIAISGGDLTLSTGDDGVHADANLAVTGGNIAVLASYEGLEAANIAISDGVIDVVSSDDGLNAAGGSDGNTAGGRFGKDTFSSGGSYSIVITGGQIAIRAGGDGLDSNGTLDVGGGTILSFINSTSDNGAIDADGTVTFTGGTIIYGGTGAGSNPGGNSTQSYVYVSGSIAAGSEITVKQDGKTLVAATVAMDCQYLAVSSPDIVSGQSYDVYNGGTLLASATAGTGGGGMMGGPGGGGFGDRGGRGGAFPGETGDGATGNGGTPPGDMGTGGPGNGTFPGNPPDGSAGNGGTPPGTPAGS